MCGSLKQNISFALRTLLKHKGFTLTAVLTIALGIGATTAIFSVVYAVFEPMPYPNPDQLVMVWAKVPNGRNSVPISDLLAWRQRSTSFQAMNAWSGASFNVSTDDRPEQVPASRRTPGMFTMEGLPMFLGRDFLPEEGELGRDRVVILSHRFWSKHFNSNRDLVGKDIRMNGEPYTVIGVLSPGTYDRLNSQVFVPLTFPADQAARDTNFMPVMARLKNGVTIGQAQAEMSGIAAQRHSEFPKTANREVSIEPLHLNFVTPSADPTKPLEWQIVGVYHNLRAAGGREDVPEINLPFVQSPFPQASMVLKTSGDPNTVIKSVTAAVASVDPDLPVAGMRTVDEIVSESLAIDRFSVVLFASFGALGLLLAAVGIYGVMAFAVAQRTHEFGVCMALGAQRSRVINQVLKEGTILAICGTVIGLGGAYLVGRAMQSTLYGVQALDIRAFGAVSFLLLLAALLACLYPAWRASRVEPLEALRYE